MQVLRISSLIDLLTKCWMVDDTSLLNSDSTIPMVYLVLRLDTLRMSYMSTQLFDTRLIDLKVLDLAYSVIESDSQLYEDY